MAKERKIDGSVASIKVNKNDVGYFQALAFFRRSVVKRSAEEHDAIGMEEWKNQGGLGRVA